MYITQRLSWVCLTRSFFFADYVQVIILSTTLFSFICISEEKVSKYNVYNGFVSRPLFASHGARVPSPSDKRKLSPSRDDPAHLSGESGSPSPPCDQLSDHTQSPHRALSSDPESGIESEKPKDYQSADRDPTDIMAKIFPHQKRDTLETMVRTCKGDIVKSIELALSSKENKTDSGSMSSSSLQSALRPSVGLPGALGALGTKSAFSPLHVPQAPGGDSVYGLNPRLGVSPLRLAYSSASGGMAGFMSPYMTSGLMPLLTLRPPLDSHSFPGMIRDLSYIQTKDSLCNTGLYARISNDEWQIQINPLWFSHWCSKCIFKYRFSNSRSSVMCSSSLAILLNSTFWCKFCEDCY